MNLDLRRYLNYFILLILLLALAVLWNKAFGQNQQCVVKTFTAEIGVRELSGHNDGAAVEKYLSSVGLPKGYPWCAAFVAYCFSECGITTVNSAWSPTWFPDDQLTDQPAAGNVFGIYFPNKRRIAHVGFIDSWDMNESYTQTVEGNTNQVGSREGDGVYRKFRLKNQIYKISKWH